MRMKQATVLAIASMLFATNGGSAAAATAPSARQLLEIAENGGLVIDTATSANAENLGEFTMRIFIFDEREFMNTCEEGLPCNSVRFAIFLRERGEDRNVRWFVSPRACDWQFVKFLEPGAEPFNMLFRSGCGPKAIDVKVDAWFDQDRIEFGK